MANIVSSSVLSGLRQEYHRRLCATILGPRVGTNVLTVADGHSRASVELAAGMAANMGQLLSNSPLEGQSAGMWFTQYTMDFLNTAFSHLQHLRPGTWQFSASQAASGITAYDQYEHLQQLAQLLAQYPEVRTAVQSDYFITPDITVSREPVTDLEINSIEEFVSQNDFVAGLTPLRAGNAGNITPPRILHASISCKWTIRSDRGQNSRTEALNLIRNRKGQTPHIVVVVMEPLPNRIASIAFGTGDIDCVYHPALHELQAAAQAHPHLAQAADMLRDMVNGRRLRDISDLPFDLAI